MQIIKKKGDSQEIFFKFGLNGNDRLRKSEDLGVS